MAMVSAIPRARHLRLIHPTSRSRVLLADGDVGRRATLQVALGQRYGVETASTSVEALTRAAGGRFDVAVLDAPVLDGALARLVGLVRGRAPGIKTIVVAARRDLRARRQAELLGVDAVLARPAPTRVLLDRLATLAGGTPRPPVDANVGRAIDLMAVDVTALLDLEGLADATGESLTALDWQFRTHVDLGVHEYVMRVRLAVARLLLRDTQLGVDTLAQLLGFANGQELATMIL